MRVIGVIDLLDGRAVHAQAGRRERYAPVLPSAHLPIREGDGLALARSYRERCGVEELYVADLDAIMGRPPQHALTAAIAATTGRLWLDAGIASVDAAARAIDCGAAHVVVGLETLPSFTVLEQICAGVGGATVAFSLDLRDGTPIAREHVVAGIESTSRLAGRAVEAGASAVLIIDLARVGTGAGVNLGLVADVRRRVPTVTLVAGGGIRGPGDLARLAARGCDGALVATALHAGRIALRPSSPGRRRTGRSSPRFPFRSA